MDDEGALRIDGSGFGHALLRAREPNGREVREAVPVRRIETNRVEVLGSPAYLMGFAAGDILSVAANHAFVVVERGPNVCVQVFADPPLGAETLDRLRVRIAELDGIVESPEHHRFAVITVPSAAGTRLIGETMNAWSAGAGRVEWQFGSTFV